MLQSQLSEIFGQLVRNKICIVVSRAAYLLPSVCLSCPCLGALPRVRVQRLSGGQSSSSILSCTCARQRWLSLKNPRICESTACVGLVLGLVLVGIRRIALCPFPGLPAARRGTLHGPRVRPCSPLALPLGLGLGGLSVCRGYSVSNYLLVVKSKVDYYIRMG